MRLSLTNIMYKWFFIESTKRPIVSRETIGLKITSTVELSYQSNKSPILLKNDFLCGDC